MEVLHRAGKVFNVVIICFNLKKQILNVLATTQRTYNVSGGNIA
jgi:hypothetical protein